MRTFRRRRPIFRRRRRVSKGYRKAVRYQQPMTIIDKAVAFWNTDASGNAWFAVNMNGAPAADNQNGMFQYGSPTSIAYTKFDKFTALQAVYEQVRCSWIKIQFFPSMPNDSVTVGAYNPVYIVKERSGLDFIPSAGFPSADAVLSEPQSYAVNRYRPFKIFQRSIKYPILNKYPMRWGAGSSTQNTDHNLWGQWHDPTKSIQDFSSDDTCHVYAQTHDGPHSVTIGTLIISAKFQCKGQLV